MKKALVCTCFLLALLLSGCGASAGKNPAAPAAPAVPGNIRFAAGEVQPDIQNLTMTLAAGETALLDQLTALRSADLSGSPNAEEIAEWAARHPQVAVRYTVTLPDGKSVPSDTQSYDLSGLSASTALETAKKLALLPGLNSVNLGAEGGALSWSDIARLREALPKPVFHYAFKLYGTDANLADTKLSLYKVRVPDDGKLVDEIIGYMPQLTEVDMDSCGLQPKRLEEINLKHPSVKVIFRVMFGDNYTARTDCERILASMASKGGMLNNGNSRDLQYCHDVKYLDLGHNTTLTDISFVAQMPKLEVAILSMCNIADASPLANCGNLEYLELANTYVSDVKPLAGLTGLRHLNIASIGYDQPHDGSPRIQLKDITPLYNLTGLERLWIGAYNPVPREQIQEMQRRAPQCEINTEVYEDPVGGRWRYLALADYEVTYVDTYADRYIKLREQFGNYDSSVYNFTWNDPLYEASFVTATPTPVPTAAPVMTPTPINPAPAAVNPTPAPEATPAPETTPEPTFVPVPTAEPVYEPVVTPEPAYQEPTYQEPTYQEPAYQEPAYQEPAQEEPAQEEPVQQPQGPTGDIVINLPTPEEQVQQFIQDQYNQVMSQYDPSVITAIQQSDYIYQ